MSQNITLQGATYSNVPAVDLPKSGGGLARFADITEVAVPYVALENEQFYTENNVRKWRIQPFVEVDVGEGDKAGYMPDNTHINGAYFEKNAVANGTTVTPTTSSQTIGGIRYMMESAVTVVGDANLVAGNIKKDVSIFGVTGTYEGGGGSGVALDTVECETSVAGDGLGFTGLLGEPTSFIVVYDDDISVPVGTPYSVADVVYDGSSFHGNLITNVNNSQVSYSADFYYNYSDGDIEVISSNGDQAFLPGVYVMFYTYGGTAANVHTADVQVGSGATSITFTGLEDEPIWWACNFKSSFSTSNGYQRVIYTVQNAGGDTFGSAMDSSAHLGQYWTTSYNNGSFTITSQGTNSGGYFHQPGYYQLTYVLADASPYEKVNKTYYASTSAQSDKVEPSAGYDAMSEVNVSIPAVSQTNLTAANIKSGTTISVSNGQSNLWSVTGTYAGGGSSTVSSKTASLSTAANTISFTQLSGQPIAWFARCTTQLSSSGSTTYYYVADCRYNGTNTQATLFRIGSTRRIQNQTTGISYSYSNGTLTITTTATAAGSTPGFFYNGTYELTYIY